MHQVFDEIKYSHFDLLIRDPRANILLENFIKAVNVILHLEYDLRIKHLL